MEKFKVNGPTRLSGEIHLDGAKNACLPIFCASLLSSEELTVFNVPRLGDVQTLLALLRNLGVEIEVDFESKTCVLNGRGISSNLVAYELVKTMRASILTLGPLLARLGEVRVSLPGGCAIGQRPVDQHIKGLEKMGAEITLREGYIIAKASKLKGARIVTDLVTVTGTENLMMAACLAEGHTVIENAAREPEIVDLARCLISMGAKIQGEGTDIIRVEGVSKLHAASHRVIPDRIEAGTFICAIAACGGSVFVRNFEKEIMGLTYEKLRSCGGEFLEVSGGLKVNFAKRPKAVSCQTAPYPGFATDMQAQLMAVNAVSDGVAFIDESIFENRFMHVSEMQRMGADIKVKGRTAVVQGKKRLSAAKLMATDLRASAGLVLAALVADGESVVDRIYHLDRGYVNMDKKLAQLGAEVLRIKG